MSRSEPAFYSFCVFPKDQAGNGSKHISGQFCSPSTLSIVQRRASLSLGYNLPCHSTSETRIPIKTTAIQAQTCLEKSVPLVLAFPDGETTTAPRIDSDVDEQQHAVFDVGVGVSSLCEEPHECSRNEPRTRYSGLSFDPSCMRCTPFDSSSLSFVVL